MDITETVFDFKALSTQQQDYFFEKIAEFDQQVFTLTCEKELKKYLYDPQAISVTIIQYHHRSSLLYAPATLILAVLAYYSQFSETINLICVVLNLAFFSFSIGAYILHGMLKDTTNQFKKPHQLGKVQLPGILMNLAMIGLIVAELGGTGILLWGATQGLF